MTNRPTIPGAESTRELHIFDALLPRYRSCSPSSLVSNMLDSKTRHYWPNGDVQSKIFLARFPDQKMLIKMASLAVKRRIKYWHPWHMELTHSVYGLGKQIDWFNPPNGDHEWIDSLVRFTHMLDLAAAYRLTHNAKFLQAFEGYLASFSESRDHPGRHWKYRLNAAIRVTNLIRAYDLIVRADTLSVDTHLAVHENLLTDIRFLSASLDDVEGNGAFFITTALLTAAEYLGDFFDVDAWAAPASERLSEIIESELQPDGIEVEQVPMYHGQVILALLDYFVALSANDRPVSDKLKRTVTRMLDVLCGLCDPQGYIPPIGDSDRFPISYLIQFHNAVLGVSYDCDTEQPVESALTSNAPTHCRLKTYEDAGWIVARWDYGRERQGYLLFDCSGKPEEGKSWHSHADDLQFLLHTTNGPIFTDPGRFTYCTEFKAFFPFTRRRIIPTGRFRLLYSLVFPGFMQLSKRNWREYFQRTLSHNTISIAGANQPQYSSQADAVSQVVFRRPRVKGPLVLLEGQFDCRNSAGKERRPANNLTHGYQHQRTIIGYLPCMWIIIDRVKAEGEHRWISSYHLDAGCKASAVQDHLELEAGGDIHDLRFMVPTGTGLDVAIDQDWVSRLYNRKQHAKTVRATICNASEAVLITVIHSHADGPTRVSEAIPVRAASDSGDSTHDIYCIRLTSNNSITRLFINPDGRAVKYNDLEFDAIVAVESRFHGRLLESGFLGGSYLRSDDFTLTGSQQEAGAFRSYGVSQS